MPKPPRLHKTPLRYPKEDHARIMLLAEALGVSHGELYRQAITNFLAKNKKLLKDLTTT